MTRLPKVGTASPESDKASVPPTTPIVGAEGPAMPTTALVGTRIKAIRSARKLSQNDLASLFGFKDRQTISAIENGGRRVKAEELAFLSEALDVPFDYFTDPFSLAGEGRFSRRRRGVEPADLEAYERKAGRWIAAYRTLAPLVGHRLPLVSHALRLSRRPDAEEAAAAGERFAAEFALGGVPAGSLAQTMERDLGMLVLMVDAEPGVSGAACRLPELDAVLVARAELRGRRHFDLAHELFHLLTWDAMPPAPSEVAIYRGGKGVERLANSFAAALLMPADRVRSENWTDLARTPLVSRLNAVADELLVTSSALRWRLVDLGEIPREKAEALPGRALHNNGHRTAPPPPPQFSKPFAEVLALALDEGRVSAKRLSSVLHLDTKDIAGMFASHGVRCTALG